MSRPDGDEFSPESLKFWLVGRCPGCRWSMLVSATEGGTGSLNGHGSGRGDRLALAGLKADLERAADSLPIHWQSTALIFHKQHRSQALSQRRQATLPVEDALRDAEDPRPSVALEVALWRMAEFLGWSPIALPAA